jgi:uncharacterized protein YutE (UPF0331/DUF86 family)
VLDRVSELRQIMGARNRVIHGYDVVDVEIHCRHESS